MYLLTEYGRHMCVYKFTRKFYNVLNMGAPSIYILTFTVLNNISYGFLFLLLLL